MAFGVGTDASHSLPGGKENFLFSIYPVNINIFPFYWQEGIFLSFLYQGQEYRLKFFSIAFNHFFIPIE